MVSPSFPDLPELARQVRAELGSKKFILLYAFNSTGKTRLSVEFKNLGRRGDERDTLYFNAFTEDLFQWDNDLENDRERVLKINQDSRFFAGLGELEMDNRIRPLLNRYADFDFRIDTTAWAVSFSREVETEGSTEVVDGIKISRGEENIFIWCFFLAIVQLTLDGAQAYRWVKYIYIDDPISSLDENNAIAVANHLAQILTRQDSGPRVVISTHHILFFNVLYRDLGNKAKRYFLKKDGTGGGYALVDTGPQPFLQHLSNIVELDQAQRSGELYTHHFNMLRRVMEQTANFFGLVSWEECIAAADGDPDKRLYKRMIDIMSHGDYSIYEPREMLEENKAHFRTIFLGFVAGYPFNQDLFRSEAPTP